MKKNILLMVALLISLVANADDYTHMTFVNSDGSITAISSTGLVITFADGEMNATNSSDELTINLSDLSKMYFSTGIDTDSTLLGDVNCDGVVDISDVLLTVDYILGKNPDSFYIANADVIEDDTIDISDVLGIVDIILGK